MLNRLTVALAAGAAALLCASSTFAQLPNPYGASIALDAARKAAAPALAEAQKNGWRMAVAVVDISGDLVFFEKMDGTQAASVTIAVDKARSSARFKRPTKALQDALAAGGQGCASWRSMVPCQSRAVCRSSRTARSWARLASPAAPASRTASVPRRAPTP